MNWSIIGKYKIRINKVLKWEILWAMYHIKLKHLSLIDHTNQEFFKSV
jgi:hypothetical protein